MNMTKTLPASGSDTPTYMKVRDWRLAFSAMFLALISVVNVVRFLKYGIIHVEDDSYYYLVTAKNIAASHISTFDGQSLTNGYHPIWMLFLVLQQMIFGTSPAIMYIVELLLLTASLYIFLDLIREENFITGAAFTVIFCIVVNSFALKGMETSIFIFFLALFISYIASNGLNTSSQACIVGILASACIGARIDAAVFIIPMVLLGLPTLRLRVTALSVLGALGLCYALFNLASFGTALPVSGSVKSIGGLQINTALFAQIAGIWQEGDSTYRNAYEALTSPYTWIIALFIGSPIIFLLSKKGSIGRILIVSFIVGFILYSAKIVFVSSWKLSVWYFYPIAIGALGYMYTIIPLLSKVNFRLANAVRVGGLVAATLAYAVVTVRPALAADARRGFHVINELALQRFGPVLNGERIAMGDKAGSLAFAYDGPLVQLEGLVNDVEYYRVLRERGDVKALLCSRGVKFVLDYEQDLGAYQDHEMSVLSPWLTSFDGPTLKVSAADEVGKVYDLDTFAPNRRSEGNVYLYLWRLQGC